MVVVQSYPCQLHENCELTHVAPKFIRLTKEHVSVIREEYRPILIDIVRELSSRTGINELQSRNMLASMLQELDLKLIREDKTGNGLRTTPRSPVVKTG